MTRKSAMGAAGFEPAATWSEAKHSVQAELSARTRLFRTCNNKAVGLAAISRLLTHDGIARLEDSRPLFGDTHDRVYGNAGCSHAGVSRSHPAGERDLGRAAHR